MKSVFSLSSLIFLRFLGLFLVLPVLSAYAISLDGANKFLVGFVVGGYAITQAIFQLPFGYLSDRFGRKNIIVIGLLIFFIGSMICAYSSNIYIMILGRLLQGAGAIGAVAVAFISDLVQEEKRGIAMAIMGSFIAFSFAIALILGPVLSSYFGVDFLFLLTAAFSILSIILLYTIIPNPPKIRKRMDDVKFKDVFKQKELIPFYITDFLQKSFMTIAFVIIPYTAIYNFSWDKSELYKVYLPATFIGILAMVFASYLAERKNKTKEVFLISISFFLLSFVFMFNANNSFYFIIAVTVFFMGFNMMEPILQSSISKVAYIKHKGSALGIANTLAYLGTFFGGIIAGIFLEKSQLQNLLLLLILISFVWFIYILTIKNSIRYTNLYIEIDKINLDKLNNLKNEYVKEWYINETENIAIIKYREEKLCKESLIKLL